MNLLVLGGGGREHALAYALKRSRKVNHVVVAPGNAGIELDGFKIFPDVSEKNLELITRIVESEKIDLVIVGPEAYLEAGVVNFLREKNILAMGPTKEASQLESSKAFSKDVMKKVGIPTAEFNVFNKCDTALEFLDSFSLNTKMVIKIDELAQGKGVVVAQNILEAKKAVESFFHTREYGVQAKKIVIEEFLAGREVSAFYLCDGERGVFLGCVCDHKRLLDGDMGPNTGGMGTYAPANWVTRVEQQFIQDRVVSPLLKYMQDIGVPYQGILFVGLMMTKEGPKVLEFNCRLGDPETQSLLPLIDEDLAQLFCDSAKGKLNQEKTSVKTKNEFSLHVVCAAHGYPGTEGQVVRKGDVISINQTGLKNTQIYFAGVTKNKKGELVTNGGRILGVTAVANSFNEARDLAYKRVSEISFSGMQFRKDIGSNT